MKIAIDISQIIYPGGVSHYTRKLAENLLNIDKKNDYLLFAYNLRQKKVIDEYIAGLEKQGFANFSFKFFPLPISLVEWLAHRRLISLERMLGRVHIYHASDWIQFSSRAKIISTVHDLAPIIYPQYHHKKIVQVHKKRLKLITKYASGVIAVSQNTKQDFLKHSSYPAEKISVIYEAPVISPSNLKIAAKPSKTMKKPYVLTVSSLNPRKNIKRLISAFEIFNTKHPNYQLMVVGSFGWGEKFQNKKNICFIGNIDNSKLARLYKNASLFVYPSLYEGFGLPILEAFGFGVPVVTSNISSMPEIAGKAAVLVDPEKQTAIAQGMKTALKRKKELVRLGLKRVQEFSWEKCAGETLGLYTNLNSKF